MIEKTSFYTLMSTLLSGLLLTASVSPAREKADGIAAVVGTDIILLSDVHSQLSIAAQKLQAQGASNPSFRDLETEALWGLIDELLVARQATELQLAVTDREIEQTILGMASQNSMDMAAFRQAVEESGTPFSLYRDSIRKDLLKYKVMNLKVRTRINVTEEMARDFYNDQVRGLRREAAFEGAHILIRVPEDAKAIDVAQLRQEALDIKHQIEGGMSFADAAKQFSQDAVTANRGGSIGVHMPDEIPSILDDVFLDMEPNELAGPIRSPAGFHVVTLLDREDLGIRRFEDVKQTIIGQLTQREMEKQERIWIDSLRKKAFIDVRVQSDSTNG